MCTHALVCEGQRKTWEIFYFHCESWGLNPGCQAWWLLSLSTEPPHKPYNKASKQGCDEPERR